jgi:hypothetical protein
LPESTRELCNLSAAEQNFYQLNRNLPNKNLNEGSHDQTHQPSLDTYNY